MYITFLIKIIYLNNVKKVHFPKTMFCTGLGKIINNLIRNIPGTFSMHFEDAIKWKVLGSAIKVSDG